MRHGRGAVGVQAARPRLAVAGDRRRHPHRGDCLGVLRAYDVSDTAVLPPMKWQLEIGGCIEATPTVWDGRIYFGTRAGRFCSRRRLTGVRLGRLTGCGKVCGGEPGAGQGGGGR